MASLTKGMSVLLELAKGQAAQVVSAKAANTEVVEAKPVKRAIPHTPELGALKGLCSPSAQATVERQFAKGAGEFQTYIEHLQEASPAFGKTPRTAYAAALMMQSTTVGLSAPKRGRPRKDAALPTALAQALDA